MRDLLEPFMASAIENQKESSSQIDMEGVQRNLVTRDGEIEKELARMRLLLVRVAGRLSALERTENRDEGRMDVDEDVECRKKVDHLLQGL